MYKECAVSLWANCEVCPDHTEQVKRKLLQCVDYRDVKEEADE